MHGSWQLDPYPLTGDIKRPDKCQGLDLRLFRFSRYARLEARPRSFGIS